MTTEAPEALYRRAKAAYDRGDLATASTLCDQVLKQRRNSLEALMLAAFAAGQAGGLEREIGYVTRAVRLKPKDAQLRTHLGLCYVRNGQLREARTQFENALKLSPGFPMALNGLGIIYERQNQHDRARRLLERHVDGAATPPEVTDVYLRLLVHDGDLDSAIALGKEVAAAGHAPSDPLRSVHFGLAQAHERVGDHERAFAAAQTANGMMALPYSGDHTRRRVDATATAFSTERMATLARSSIDSEAPVFIVGLPRTGSTLVERILDAHPAVHGAGEMLTVQQLTSDLRDHIGSGAHYPACVGDLDETQATALGREVLGALTRKARDADRVTDKCLANFWHLGLIELLLPGSRIIHCRRDPLDTCLSCFMSRLLPMEARYAANLEHLGVHYRQYERMMSHWRSALRLPILDVQYESLIDDQPAETRRLLEFCGLPWHEGCLRFHETKRQDRTLSLDQVRQPIYRTSVGRAERFGALLNPLRRALDEGAGPASG